MGVVRRQTSPHAAPLRRAMTEAERVLRSALRNRQLNGFKFRRQATVGRYVVDFLCVAARLVVEVDGGQHGAERDTARTAALETAGFRVLRFWNNDVLANTDGVLLAIAATASREERRPSPNPLPRAGEG